MKRAFVPRQTFRRTPVVHFNEIKLVKEDDIEDKERRSKNIVGKWDGGQRKGTFKALSSNPDKRLLESVRCTTQRIKQLFIRSLENVINLRLLNVCDKLAER